MKLSRATASFVASLFLISLVPAWRLVDYSICNRCIERWCGDDFITYTGQCTEVYFESGFEFSRYSPIEYQDFTGQGWHLILDNGRGYYIPEYLEQELSLCNTDALSMLESKEVTVVCLPETVIPFFNIIVSLESDDIVYVDEATTYSYIIQGMANISKSIKAYFALLSPVILFEIIIFCDEIASARERSKKAKHTQEKIQRLRVEGKLHPKNQQKQKQSTNNKHPQQ